MKITKDNNESIYIFSWNGGEIIEQHTEKSFLDKYNKENNSELYEDLLEVYYPINHKIYNLSLEEFFEDNFLANEDCCRIDNMFVVRL